MQAKEYSFIKDLVYRHSRINLGPDKQLLVSARLGKRLRATNTASIGEYCALLNSPQGRGELANLIDAISTNHTFFFREEAHFATLQSELLPELLSRRQAESWPQLRVWSAACSSGEEPYSIAIALAEYFQHAPQPWAWHIDATDISHRILARAKEAIYPTESVQKVNPTLVRKYFEKGFGELAGKLRVRETLRRQISFHHLNLLEGQAPFREKFHIIFCRNVMIYFDAPTQAQLVDRFSRMLVPGGFLLVGHSESLTGMKHAFKIVRPATYRWPGP